MGTSWESLYRTKIWTKARKPDCDQTEARPLGPMNAEENQILQKTEGKLLKIFFGVEGLHEQTAIMG